MGEEKNNGYIKWKAFSIIVTILFTLVLGAYALAGKAFSKATTSETNIEWIKSSLYRIENNLGINK